VQKSFFGNSANGTVKVSIGGLSNAESSRGGVCVMFKRKRAVILPVAVFLALSVGSATMSVGQTSVVVVPSRYTVVQFAFDIANLRSVFLVAYEASAEPESPVMHIWDNTGREWVATNIGEYNSGTLFGVAPRLAIIIGDSERMVSRLAQVSSWAEEVKQIPTLGIVAIVNSLNESLAFSPYEWRWLAARHRLKLNDLNAERRRYGRYGRYGSRGGKRTRPMPGAQRVIMPPTESAAATVPTASFPYTGSVDETAKPGATGTLSPQEEEIPPEDK